MKKVSNKLIKRSRRSSRGIINMALFIIIVIILFSIFSTVNANKYYTTKKIVVCEGETLWTIASNICDKNDDLDIYSVIRDIKKLNNMTDSRIYAGDTLLIFEK